MVKIQKILTLKILMLKVLMLKVLKIINAIDYSKSMGSLGF